MKNNQTTTNQTGETIHVGVFYKNNDARFANGKRIFDNFGQYYAKYGTYIKHHKKLYQFNNVLIHFVNVETQNINKMDKKHNFDYILGINTKIEHPNRLPFYRIWDDVLVELICALTLKEETFYYILTPEFGIQEMTDYRVIYEYEQYDDLRDTEKEIHELRLKLVTQELKERTKKFHKYLKKLGLYENNYLKIEGVKSYEFERLLYQLDDIKETYDYCIKRMKELFSNNK